MIELQAQTGRKILSYIQEEDRRKIYLVIAHYLKNGYSLKTTIEELVRFYTEKEKLVENSRKENRGPFVNPENQICMALKEFDKNLKEDYSVVQSFKMSFGGVDILEEMCLSVNTSNETLAESFLVAAELLKGK